jgi:hypothetical protein
MLDFLEGFPCRNVDIYGWRKTPCSLANDTIRLFSLILPIL